MQIKHLTALSYNKIWSPVSYTVIAVQNGYLSINGCVVVLCLRLCLRRYNGGFARWSPGLGLTSLPETVLADGSMKVLCLRWDCFWKWPLRPATWPFSMARSDWRLYSSLAQQAFLVISSSAALQRHTKEKEERWLNA